MNAQPIAEFAAVIYQGSVERHAGRVLWLEYCGCADCGPAWAAGQFRYELVDDGGVSLLRHVRAQSVSLA